MSWLSKILPNKLFHSHKVISFQQIVNVNRVMDLALGISGNHVMCLDLRRNSVYDLYGRALFGNNVGIDVCYTYVHPDDRVHFKTFIERLRQGIDREAECRYRWDYNYTGHGAPDWHDMYCYAVAEYEGGRPVNILATLTDESKLYSRKREIERLSEQYRLIFEHSIVGLSFYSPDGYLIAANRIMREICHFDSDAGDEFFSRVNLFDLAPFNEVFNHHDVHEYWACSLSVIPERDMHVYLEIRVIPVYDNEGRLIYISVTARDISEERNIYIQAKENALQLEEVRKSMMRYEEELRYMMESCQMRAWRLSFADRRFTFYKGLSTIDRQYTTDEMADYYIKSERAREMFDHAEETFAQPGSFIADMRSVFDDSGERMWNQINCIPEYDDEGRQIGAFGVVRNITDLMQKQEELRQETERAKESGHLKSVFLANMTHEIRTPLNAIVGFTDVLPMMTTADEKQEVIRVILNNCDMLLRLVNDILVVASIDTGGITIEPVSVDFAHAFNSLCEELRPRIQETGVEYLVDNPYDTLMVKVDETRVRQVLTNFVTNAVKYTQQGHIRVGYRQETRNDEQGERTGLYIYCEDTGSGIAQESQQKIFDRFFKVNDYIQGTGLGLSICKAIADAYHGYIGVTSAGEGHGSTFWIWIPVEVKSEELRVKSEESANAGEE